MAVVGRKLLLHFRHSPHPCGLAPTVGALGDAEAITEAQFSALHGSVRIVQHANRGPENRANNSRASYAYRPEKRCQPATPSDR
jgi:hypothetical protein